jgi:hypothetical protein
MQKSDLKYPFVIDIASLKGIKKVFLTGGTLSFIPAFGNGNPNTVIRIWHSADHHIQESLNDKIS